MKKMIKPKEEVPQISINLVNDTKWDLNAQEPEHFTMIIFYRGKHCPVCKSYLQELQHKISEFTQLGVNVIAISADTEKIGKATYDEWDISDIPIGFGYPIEEAKKWELFISKGTKKEEPPEFIEPGLFLINPDGTLYSSSIQSMPFARPGFDDLLKGLQYIIKKEYPARGAA
jgi:peroxiredoxin